MKLTSTNIQFIESMEVQSLVSLVQNYIETALFALLVWHYLLTFEREVTFFWKWKFSGACALFLANHYIVLVDTGYQLSRNYSQTSHMWQCKTRTYVQATFWHSQYIVWAAFSALRVYALQRQRALAAAVLFLSLAPPMYGLAMLGLVVFDNDPVVGCFAFSHVPSIWDQRMQIATRVCLIVAEIIVMVVTWMKLRNRHHGGDAGRLPRRMVTLSCVLYENGRIYFVLTILLHAVFLFSVSISFSIVKHPALFYFVEFSPLFVEPTIGLLVNHFLITLQEAASRRTHNLEDIQLCSATYSTATSSAISVLQFARADVDEWIHSEAPGALLVIPGDRDAGVQEEDPVPRWGAECIAALQTAQQSVLG